MSSFFLCLEQEAPCALPLLLEKTAKRNAFSYAVATACMRRQALRLDRPFQKQ